MGEIKKFRGRTLIDKKLKRQDRGIALVNKEDMLLLQDMILQLIDYQDHLQEQVDKHSRFISDDIMKKLTDLDNRLVDTERKLDQ